MTKECAALLRCAVAASTPIANNNVAHECRRSCSRIIRTSARPHNGSNARLTLLGSRGVPVLCRENQTECVGPCDLGVTELIKGSLAGYRSPISVPVIDTHVHV
jgi:hypothetical protein